MKSMSSATCLVTIVAVLASLSSFGGNFQDFKKLRFEDRLRHMQEYAANHPEFADALGYADSVIRGEQDRLPAQTYEKVNGYIESEDPEKLAVAYSLSAVSAVYLSDYRWARRLYVEHDSFFEGYAEFIEVAPATKELGEYLVFIMLTDLNKNRMTIFTSPHDSRESSVRNWTRELIKLRQCSSFPLRDHFLLYFPFDPLSSVQYAMHEGKIDDKQRGMIWYYRTIISGSEVEDEFIKRVGLQTEQFQALIGRRQSK